MESVGRVFTQTHNYNRFFINYTIKDSKFYINTRSERMFTQKERDVYKYQHAQEEILSACMCEWNGYRKFLIGASCLFRGNEALK